MAPNRLKFAFFRLQLHEFVKYTILLQCIPIVRVQTHIYLQPKVGWVKVWTPKTFKKGPKPPHIHKSGTISAPTLRIF